MARPFECPACGHEGIARQPAEMRSETGMLRVRIVRWICRLCAYSWQQPAGAVPKQ